MLNGIVIYIRPLHGLFLLVYIMPLLFGFITKFLGAYITIKTFKNKLTVMLYVFLQQLIVFKYKKKALTFVKLYRAYKKIFKKHVNLKQL